MSSLNRKITVNKTKHFLNDNDLSYYRGKQYFDEGSGKQNHLVFLPLRKYFKFNAVAGAADYVLSWPSKGLSNESIKPPTTTNNSLTPELNYYGTKTKIKFTRSCLKQSCHIFTHKKVVNIYIVYKLAASSSHNSDPTIKNRLFGAVTLTKNADVKKYKYSGYGIGFDRRVWSKCVNFWCRYEYFCSYWQYEKKHISTWKTINARIRKYFNCRKDVIN